MNSEFKKGRYTYLVLDVKEKPFTVQAGSQMRAARKIERAMKLPPRWYLKLRVGGKTIDWWTFDEFAHVVVPSA